MDEPKRLGRFTQNIWPFLWRGLTAFVIAFVLLWLKQLMMPTVKPIVDNLLIQSPWIPLLDKTPVKSISWIACSVSVLFGYNVLYSISSSSFESVEKKKVPLSSILPPEAKIPLQFFFVSFVLFFQVCGLYRCAFLAFLAFTGWSSSKIFTYREDAEDKDIETEADALPTEQEPVTSESAP